MRLFGNATLLGKTAKEWKDKDGIARISYKGNIMQNNGEIIDTIRLTQEQYNTLIAGKVYTITVDADTRTNDGHIRIVDIAETK